MCRPVRFSAGLAIGLAGRNIPAFKGSSRQEELKRRGAIHGVHHPWLSPRFDEYCTNSLPKVLYDKFARLGSIEKANVVGEDQFKSDFLRIQTDLCVLHGKSDVRNPFDGTIVLLCLQLGRNKCDDGSTRYTNGHSRAPLLPNHVRPDCGKHRTHDDNGYRAGLCAHPTANDKANRRAAPTVTEEKMRTGPSG
jgi:hypothetical protein